MDVVFQILSPVVAAFVTYLFTSMHYRRKTWGEFKLRRFDEFYGPILDQIKLVTANSINTSKVNDASEQAWQEECEKHPHPFEDHDKHFEPFQKALDYENERFHKEDISALVKILEIFKSKGRLAYPSTEKLFPEYLQYVDLFLRPLPYEVQKKLDHSAEPLAKLHADVEAHFNNLKRKLSGEKRV